MSTIVTRAGKGSPLTHNEVDANFTNLNTDKYQSGDAVTFASAVVIGSATINGTSIPNNKTLVVTTDIGTSVQAYDAQLADIAGLTPTDNNFIVGNGTNFVTESGSTARTSLGLGSIATQDANNVSITGGSVSGITDLAVADGGTGASNASDARSNLGLAIGTNVQAYSAELQGATQGGINGMKNRIINGAMQIDQRNAGASVTVTDAYTLDRWEAREDTDGAMTVQQVSDAPTGFINSLKVTTTTADASLGATQRVAIGQFIEGLNCSDLAFGSASASTVTLSFQVKSSLTGTFGGALANSARNRSYPFTYTINSANTWETKTVTIAGDTTGTWLTTNGIGLRVYFGLGVGSTYSGTAGSWAGAEYYTATGATSVIGTLSATWQVTGVQLEKGSTATSFDYRPYGTELQLCQRYYYKMTASSSDSMFGTAFNSSTTNCRGLSQFSTIMRTTPSALETSGTAGDYRVLVSGVNITCSSVPVFGGASQSSSQVDFPVSSGLTSGQGSMMRATNSSAFLAWSAEL